MSKTCKECPFVRSTPLMGSVDWLEDILKLGLKEKKDFYHSCHVTDPNADGFLGGKKRECIGHINMIMNELDKTPGRNGVYNNYHELCETYLRHWLGNDKFEKLKSKKTQK